MQISRCLLLRKKNHQLKKLPKKKKRTKRLQRRKKNVSLSTGYRCAMMDIQLKSEKKNGKNTIKEKALNGISISKYLFVLFYISFGMSKCHRVLCERSCASYIYITHVVCVWWWWRCGECVCHRQHFFSRPPIFIF